MGSPHALNAPEWTHWTHPTLRFQQPRASFAALFGRMAMWDVNRDDVGFPERSKFLSLELMSSSASPLLSNDLVGAINLGRFKFK